MYCSNHSHVLLVCLFWNACCTSCRSSSDGEEYFGNSDTYEEQQDQQQFVNQGKYSMCLPCCTIHYIIYSLCMCLILLNYKDTLVVDELYLDSYGVICIWVEC
jgi:hypothetical protein